MKRLYLLRHAKSDRADPAQSMAEDGRLNKRGRRAAAALGRYMRQEGLVPALVSQLPRPADRRNLGIAGP